MKKNFEIVKVIRIKQLWTSPLYVSEQKIDSHFSNELDLVADLFLFITFCESMKF